LSLFSLVPMPCSAFLGSGSFSHHSQNMTVAARATAERKTFGHRSYWVATRRQSCGRPNMISIGLRRFWRRLSCLMGLPRDFLPGMQGFIPLSFNASLNQSASQPPVGQQPFDLRQVAKEYGGTHVVTDLACSHEESDRAAIGIGDGMQLGVHAAVGQPIRRPL
jgi:hypothetical protein